jgi:hypothetical protein
VLAVLVLALLFFELVDWYAGYRIEVTQRGWARTLGSWDEILERYPPREANAAALELERQSAALGIDLATRSYEGRERPAPKKVLAFRRVKLAIGEYLQEQIERPHREAKPPPPELAAFLDAHRAELETMQEVLRHGEAPYWELRLDLTFEAPVPNLLGQIDLQRLLLAETLERNARGDRGGARAGLEASWKLNRALRDDPQLITQLIAMAVTRMQVGVLRQLEVAPDAWLRRLSEHDFRESLFLSMQLEARLMTLIDHGALIDGELMPLQRLLVILGRPYARFCFATVSDEFRRRLDRLAEVEAMCWGRFADTGVDLEVPVPRWNLLGKLVVPYLGGAVERLARLELDLELSGKLLELEAARAGGGVWPPELPGIEASAVCPAERWVYRIEPDGGMTIAFSREHDWRNYQGPILPARFRVGP